MTPDFQTESSVHAPDTVREHLAHWVLLAGDRKTVAGIVVVAFIAVVWSLASARVLAVGPGSSVATIFGSGLASGVATIVTISLSINQLVLSRVFGSVNTLTERLDGTRDLRQNVEELAGVSATPNDPADFLSLLATTISDRASGLLSTIDGTDWDPPPEITDALDDFVGYGQSIDMRLHSNATVTDVINVVLGSDYAMNMTAVHHITNEYQTSMPAEARSEFQAIEELLESIAVVRQFYKTIAIQQDFATLSAYLVYTGLCALLSTVLVTLIYRTNSVELPLWMLPGVVSLGLGIIVAPMAIFVAYILRAATIARQTVSVGPFVPPRNQ